MNHGHKEYMARCIELANKGFPLAFPNPLVGSVIVYENKIIGEGYHSMYGQAHAEVNAIKSVANKKLLKEATLYVNLEPCAHYGKTPPCSDLIIEYKIPRVVIGCIDSFSKVSGKGIEKLQKAGVSVIVNVLEEESRKLNKRFFTFHEEKRPYIILKWARTKDGFIAPVKNHQENRWITNKKTQMLVHKWRSEEQAILVGKNTVIKDDPTLTTREWPGSNPLRIIIDKNLETRLGSYKLYEDRIDTLIFNQVKEGKEANVDFCQLDFSKNVLPQVLKDLHRRTIQSLIVEGGEKTLQEFIDLNLYDEVRILEGDKIFNKGVKEPKINVKIAAKLKIQEDVFFSN